MPSCRGTRLSGCVLRVINLARGGGRSLAERIPRQAQLTGRGAGISAIPVLSAHSRLSKTFQAQDLILCEGQRGSGPDEGHGLSSRGSMAACGL